MDMQVHSKRMTRTVGELWNWCGLSDDFALLPLLVHLAVRLYMYKRRTSSKLVMKTLRAAYAAASGWPADLRTIVEPDPEAISRALCRSEGGDDVTGIDCSWWCLRRG